MEGINGVHDPTIIEHEGIYYLFSTDTQQPMTMGIPIRSSKDLVHWQFETTAFSEMPVCAVDWSHAQGLWALEVIKYQQTFRMYYSASTFGSTTSFIGLATAPHPLGPWIDQGEIVKTSPALAAHNAIDANIVTDRDKEQWLVYGSFFDGIYLAPIDKETGKMTASGYGQRIAYRPTSVDTAIEGAFIHYHPQTDIYYLFVSFDSLHDSYHIRVARAKEITGPYLDWRGNVMTDQEEDPAEIGTKILGSYQFLHVPAVYAPGHNSIFQDTDGDMYLVHHARRRPFSDDFYLNIRKLFWLITGWPVVSAMTFQQSDTERPTPAEIVGEWEFIQFDATSEVTHAQHITIDKIEKNGENYLWQGQTFSAYFEQVNDKKELCLSGMNAQGYSFIGKKCQF